MMQTTQDNRFAISRRLAPAVLLLLLSALPASAQRATVQPSVLYPGENVITITSAAGIRSISVLQDSAQRGLYEFRKTGIIGGCPTSTTIEFRVNTASQSISPIIVVEKCDGSAPERYAITLNTTWNLDEVLFPDAEIGEEVCRPFQVRLDGVLGTAEQFLDSVSSTDERVSFRFSFPPPIGIRAGTTYRYNVCFRADRPGTYRFPVITWIRRDQPAGGYTNYPVADTGVIRVLPKRGDVTLTEVALVDPDTTGLDNPQPVTDPTTFRSVAIPNAVRPKKGKFFIGSYDVIGLVAGYSVADELLLFAGGAPPTPDDWGGVNGDMFGAFGIGAKVGATLFGKLDIAGGYVFGQSILDREATVGELDSKIRAHVPWASISYGTDDTRGSITGGYALKRHETWLPNHPTRGDWRDVYDTNAVFLAAGGDYRFARHWKVAAESAYMETVDIIPLIVTARYFTNRFAIDLGAVWAGFTINEAEPPPIPIAPMLSAVFVF